MDINRWHPPLPPEHGAKSLLFVALGTPVTVAIGLGIPLTTERLALYVPICGIGVGGLLFREAVRSWLRPRSEDSRTVGRFIAIEGIALAVLIGILVKVHHPGWAVLSVLFVVVAGEAWLSRYWQVKPLQNAIIGVFVIGALVPAGLLLLGLTDPANLVVVYGLFSGYHLFAVLRVAITIHTLGSLPTLALLVPIAVVALAFLGYGSGILGVGAPAVFGLSGLRSGQLKLRNSTPSLKRLGQAEAMFSLVFVLAGPFLLR